MTLEVNSSISVDCVVFGFDEDTLKVLLVKRDLGDILEKENDLKLPGSMIYQDEALSDAAYRILEQMTGIRNVFLNQLHVFSEPNRVCGQELEWLNKFYNISTNRVITVAYYALVNLNDKFERKAKEKRGEWIDVQLIKHLGLDHKKIVMRALETLAKEFVQSPIAFELLPRKFTLRQLQLLYEAVLGIEIDNRNFRKKILSSGYLNATDEKQVNVAHKPAQYFTFNKNKYQRSQRNKFRLNFIS